MYGREETYTDNIAASFISESHSYTPSFSRAPESVARVLEDVDCAVRESGDRKPKSKRGQVMSDDNLYMQ